MQLLIRIFLLGTISYGLAAQAQARDKTCVESFAEYKSINTPHKAFAATNGTFPGHGDMACGMSAGNDLGHVMYDVIRLCKGFAKKAHFSGKCIIIRKQ